MPPTNQQELPPRKGAKRQYKDINNEEPVTHSRSHDSEEDYTTANNGKRKPKNAPSNK
jgi:hypothetical protein